MKNPKPIKPYTPVDFNISRSALVCSKCGYRFFNAVGYWGENVHGEFSTEEIKNHVCKDRKQCDGSGWLPQHKCPGCKNCSLPELRYAPQMTSYEEAMVLGEILHIDNQTFPDEIEFRPAPVPAGKQLGLFN